MKYKKFSIREGFTIDQKGDVYDIIWLDLWFWTVVIYKQFRCKY